MMARNLPVAQLVAHNWRRLFLAKRFSHWPQLVLQWMQALSHAPYHVSNVLVQSRLPNVGLSDHFCLFHARMPRVKQLQDPGPETLWDHHPGTPKVGSLAPGSAQQPCGCKAVAPMPPLGILPSPPGTGPGPDWSPATQQTWRLPRVHMLQHEHFSWLWNRSRHPWQR
ncbi:hypothetical protein MRX96_041456 [Rhipicephalus microplus]